MKERPARRRIAVVLMNLGGPDGPDAVRPFLFNLFNDPAIIGLPGVVRTPLARLISSRREAEAQANYARMGGRSPLLPETEKQAEALRAELEQVLPRDEVRAFIAMRYWNPMTPETARAVEAFGPDEIILLPLYPQFSTTTTASSLKAWKDAYRGGGVVRAVCCYPRQDGLIEAHAALIAQGLDQAGGRPVRVLFSAHGIPENRIRAGDPYEEQVLATAGAVAAHLDLPDWGVCYQSRVGPLKWLGPSTPEAIRQAAAERLGVVVSPIAFVSEHVETLVELDRDYAALAGEVGCDPYIRVPALGVEPTFIGGLAQAVIGSLTRNSTAPTPCGQGCLGDWKACPQQGRAA